MKHIPRKRFGQNFLNSPGVIRKIVDAIAPRAGDLMVEIGPGLAALTEPLIECLPHLHVVEIDRDLIAGLKERFTPEQLTIHEGDALKFDFGALATAADQPLRVVGNLPYNISSPLLFHLTDFADQVKDMHFMLQKEVVDRMAAEPGSGEFGRLSVMLQYRYWIERLFIVPPGAFTPPPKVDSAIVRLIPKTAEHMQICNVDLLGSVVTAAFSQRRKMLRKNLKEVTGEALLEAAGIPPTARAEDVPVEDWVRLVNLLGASRQPAA
ncbi:MAG TPA: 16S rRNA (adenine(1518)-N(6)/adenine(1519)-N(6))-dimethyltransferase RsmA [Rhodocyclaceae bacterium]|nr:16S rRNA (adenine(1518)-N(6)/adenine(1519)-N(6))-dimethyltransferase RsmA [Rhodocyclaceae bacterium]